MYEAEFQPIKYSFIIICQKTPRSQIFNNFAAINRKPNIVLNRVTRIVQQQANNKYELSSPPIN